MTKILAFVLILGTCSALKREEDFSNDNSETHKIDRPQACLQKLNHCLSRRICYPRMKDLDIACCKQSFIDEKFNGTIQDDCLDEKFESDLGDCMEELEEEDEDEDCMVAVFVYLLQNSDKYDAFEEEIEKAVGVPENRNKCSRYSDELEEELRKRCEKNTDEDLEWICSLFSKIMQNSPLSTWKCMESFGECIVESLNASTVQKTYISCCKGAMANPGDYFPKTEMCLKKNMGKVFMDCLQENPEECIPHLVAEYMEDKDAIRSFKKEVENIIGEPQNVLRCKEHFQDSVTLMLSKCKLSINQRLNYFCQILQRIFQHPEEMKGGKYRISQKRKDTNEI